MAQTADTREQEARPQSGSRIEAYKAAKHELAVGMEVLALGEVLLGSAIFHVDRMEKHAKTRALEVLDQYTDDMNAGVTFPLNGSEVLTTRAAFDGLVYQSDLEKDLTPEVHDATAIILESSVSNEALGQTIENFVESELLLRLGDEIIESADDLAGKSPIINAGRQVHDTLHQGLPLSEEHFQMLSGVLGHVQKVALGASGLALLEQPIKRIVKVLQESPRALQEVIGQELSAIISFDPSRNLDGNALSAQLKGMVAGLNDERLNQLVASEGFDWDKLGTVIAAEFVIRRGQELFARDEEGKAHTPEHLQRIATAVEMIGSLDKHQKRHSLQNAQEAAQPAEPARR